MGASTLPWPQVPVGNKDHTSAAVVIIGAGISGMCMAIDLIKRNQCHNFIIVEKSSGVGGTWNDNRYPGCCCDIRSSLYSYSFEQNPNWTREYPGQEEILDYLRNVAHKYKLYKYIRFNTSVDSAAWDDSTGRWRVDVRVAGGKDAEFNPAYTIEADFLVSAVGQLNQPSYPQIEGLSDFKGKVMHSARWDWSYSTEGRNIGVIGNGATATQIVPEMLPTASALTVYQRSPNWIIPRLDEPISAFRRFLYRHVPPILWRARALNMDLRESFHSAIFDSSSAFADQIRETCAASLKTQLPGRPDLWDKLTPHYSPGCKRVIVSDDYYPALASTKTTLETRNLSRITPTGIQVHDAATNTTTHHEHDMLILATGFRAVEFLTPIHMTGTQGHSLSSLWQQTGASALYGTVVPSLPNFGLLYGPNTNLGHNSIVLMIEAQSRYLNALVGAVLDARHRGGSIALVPKKLTTEAYNEALQDELMKSSFADPKCVSWYKNTEGRITANWSGTVMDYQELLETVDWDDFEVLGVDGASKGTASGVVFGGGGIKKTKVGRVVEETRVSNLGLVVSGLGVLAVGVAWVWRGSKGRGLW